MGGFPYYPIFGKLVVWVALCCENLQPNGNLCCPWCHQLPGPFRSMRPSKNGKDFSGIPWYWKPKKKEMRKKLCFCMLKTCEKRTRRKHLVEILCLWDASEDLWLWPLRSSPSLWGSAFPLPRRAMRSSWSRPPWLSKSSSKNKLKWATKKTLITFHWILVG